MFYIGHIEHSDIQREFENLKSIIKSSRLHSDKHLRVFIIRALCKVSRMILKPALNVVTNYNNAVMSILNITYSSTQNLASFILDKMAALDRGTKGNVLWAFKKVTQWEGVDNRYLDTKLTTIESVYNTLYSFFSNNFAVLPRLDNPDYMVDKNTIRLKWCTITLDIDGDRIRQTTRLKGRKVDDFEIGDIEYTNYINMIEVQGGIKPGHLASNDYIVNVAIENASAGLSVLTKV